jgi:hypothetical protein
LKIIIGNPETQRKSICQKYTLVKLPFADDTQYEALANYKEYNHEEILIALQDKNWCSNIFG